jgi:hypothetical protein
MAKYSIPAKSSQWLYNHENGLRTHEDGRITYENRLRPDCTVKYKTPVRLSYVPEIR